MERVHRKKKLLSALKEAGLPFTVPNFIVKYERLMCSDSTCPLFKKPYLVSPRRENNDRIYTTSQIKNIIKTAKKGWFTKHWHWQPSPVQLTKNA